MPVQKTKSTKHRVLPTPKNLAYQDPSTGCYTCRIRKIKCDKVQDHLGRCQTCTRLNLECLGFGVERHELLKARLNTREVVAKIKQFLADQKRSHDKEGSSYNATVLSLDTASDFSDHKTIEELVRRLEIIFADQKLYKKLLASNKMTAQKFLNGFQRLLDIMEDPSPSFKRNLIVAAQRLSAKSGIYPECYELRGVNIPDLSECFGGFADIFKGAFKGCSVCLKMIRLNKSTQREHFLKIVSKEAILWDQLRHPNLLPFYGIYRFKNRVSLVSPWMENGNINEYLSRHVASNRVGLLYDITQGLHFLHKNGVIHGDLKGTNVLVNELGRACLADFGLSSISDSQIIAWTSNSSASSKGGTVRWQSPELFDPEGEDEKRNDEASDIYAWSCVAYEIFSGEIPFANLARQSTIILKVTNGGRPTRPHDSSLSWNVWGLTDDIWSLMEDCWKSDPAVRPTIDVVIEKLTKALPVGYHETNEVVSALSPAHFREMIRRASDVDELSDVEMLESLCRL